MERLSNWRLAIYAGPAIALAALTLPLYSFIPVFYAERLGLSLASLGLALFAVRLFDAVNDPLIGWLTDRIRSGFGRRRFWFALSVPFVMLGVWNLFWPPEDATVWHVAGWTLVLSIGYSFAILPYTSWGAELETSYDGRARVAGWREGFTLVGTLVAIAVPFTIGWGPDVESFHGFALLAVIIVIALPLLAALTLLMVPEPKEHSRTRVSFTEGWRFLAQNAPFKRLLLAFFLNGFGNSIAATLFLLYCAQRLDLEELRGPLILLYFFAGIIGVPFWTWLAGKIGKHRTWCTAIIFAMVVFAPAPFLPEGRAWAFGAVCLLSGLALGADLTQPAAMQADVIDVDTAASGEQRSGVYFALWSLATKMSLALTAITVLPLLEWFGFNAGDAAQSTAIGITLLGYIYGWGPILLKIPALVLIWNFPLTEEDVKGLRKRIDEGTQQ